MQAVSASDYAALQQQHEAQPPQPASAYTPYDDAQMQQLVAALTARLRQEPSRSLRVAISARWKARDRNPNEATPSWKVYYGRAHLQTLNRGGGIAMTWENYRSDEYFDFPLAAYDYANFIYTTEPEPEHAMEPLQNVELENPVEENQILMRRTASYTSIDITDSTTVIEALQACKQDHSPLGPVVVVQAVEAQLDKLCKGQRSYHSDTMRRILIDLLRSSVASNDMPGERPEWNTLFNNVMQEAIWESLSASGIDGKTIQSAKVKHMDKEEHNPVQRVIATAQLPQSGRGRGTGRGGRGARGGRGGRVPTCFTCGQPGHYSYQCHTFQGQSGDGPASPPQYPSSYLNRGYQQQQQPYQQPPSGNGRGGSTRGRW